MKYLYSAVNAVFATLLAAGLGAAGWFGWSWYEAERDDARRAEAIAAAETAVHTVYSVSLDSVDSDLARIQEVVTGDMASAWEERGAWVREMVNDNASELSGEVLSAAYVEGNSTKATVLVAVKVTSTFMEPPPDAEGDAEDEDAESSEEGEDAAEEEWPKDVVTHYRLVAELVSVDGEWKLAGLDLAGQPVDGEGQEGVDQ